MVSTGRRIAAVLVGGTLAGLLAGVLMILAAMIHSGAVGNGFWLPLRTIAAMWYGVEALVAPSDVVLIGLITHLVVSAGWGVVFAALTSVRSSLGASLVSGLAYGGMLWLVMTWVVLPIVDPVMYERIRLVPVMWFVFHLIYGGSLLIVPALERAIAGIPRSAVATEP